MYASFEGMDFAGYERKPNAGYKWTMRMHRSWEALLAVYETVSLPEGLSFREAPGLT